MMERDTDPRRRSIFYTQTRRSGGYGIEDGGLLEALRAGSCPREALASGAMEHREM